MNFLLPIYIWPISRLLMRACINLILQQSEENGGLLSSLTMGHPIGSDCVPDGEEARGGSSRKGSLKEGGDAAGVGGGLTNRDFGASRDARVRV